MSNLDDCYDHFIDHDDFRPLRENYIKAPFGWPGGKGRSIKKIIPHLPYRRKFIEVCGGSGAVLMAREPSVVEVFNDRASGVTDFFRVIQDPKTRDELIQRVEHFVNGRETFLWCRDTWQTSDPVLRAAKWYYMIQISFTAQGRNFGRALNHRTIGKHLINLQHFPAISNRLRGVLIENQDMFQIMSDYDGTGAVFYIDPPYIDVSSGLYDYNLTRTDHLALVNKIFTMDGFVALSGYPNSIYDGHDGWTERIEYEVDVTLAGGSFTEENNMKGKEELNGCRKQTEVLWIKEAA